MRRLRAVVIDDEPLAREGLAEQLARIEGVDVVATFPDARAALDGLAATAADVLFVDIQMPGITGLELVEALDLEPLPSVVFVTAHDAHAVRAFELNALDYVLKPPTLERLRVSIDRVRAVPPPDDAEFRRRLSALLAALPSEERGVGRLIVREVGQIVVVATGDVDWIEGADYYAKLHVGPRVHLLRESLGSLEGRLDARQFMRVHRSAIVNLTRVRAVSAEERGAGVISLTTGAKIRVTAERRLELERRLEGVQGSEPPGRAGQP